MVDWVWVGVGGVAVVAAAFVVAGFGLGWWGSEGVVRKARLAIWPSLVIERIELPLLIVLAPLFLFSATLGVIGVGVIAALWVGRWATRGYFLPRTPLNWAIAIMCAMIPVGLMASPDMGWSAGRAETILYGVALFYGVVAWVDGVRRLEMATLLYLAAGGGMAGLALLGTAWQYKVPVIGDIAQLFPQVAQGLSRDSTGFHPNIVAGALLFVVLPLVSLFAGTWSEGMKAGTEEWYEKALHDRRVLVALLLLTGGTLVLTQSRGALVAVVVGLIVMAWMYGPRMRRVAAVIGVAGVVLVGVMLAGWWKATPLEVSSEAATSVIYDENVVVRFDIWRSALKGIEEYPITGVGLDAFHKLLPIRYPEASVPDSYDVGHAHNQLLQAALDLGLPGLVGFLALWIVAGGMALGIRNAGFAAALAAGFVHGLVDAVVMVSKPGVLFWAMLALVAAGWRVRAMGDRTGSVATIRPPAK